MPSSIHFHYLLKSVVSIKCRTLLDLLICKPFCPIGQMCLELIVVIYFFVVNLYPLYFNLPFHQTYMDFLRVILDMLRDVFSSHLILPNLPPKKITKFSFVPRLTAITDEKINLKVFQVF